MSKTDKSDFIFYVVVAVIFVLLPYNSKNVDTYELMNCIVTIKEKPRLSGKSNDLVIEIDESDYSLYVDRGRKDKMYTSEFIDKAEAFSQVNILMKKKDYQRYILNNDTRTIFQGNWIEIYGVNYKEKDYFSLSEYKEFAKKDNEFSILLGVGAFVFLILFFFTNLTFREYITQKGYIVIVWFVILIIL